MNIIKILLYYIMSSKKKSLSNKISIDFKKISKLYKTEYEKVEKMTSKDVENMELKINNLEEIKNEDKMMIIIRNIIDNRSYNLNIEQMNALGKELKTKNTKKVNRCLSAFDNVEEVKSNEWSGKKYSVTKGNKKYFVKVKNLKMDQNGFERLRSNIEVNNIASKLGLVAKIHDIFFCKDNDGVYKLFVITEKIDGITLDEWLEKNKLNDTHKKQLKDLVDKCFENNILMNWLSNSKIMVIQQKRGVRFIFTSLSNASSINDIIRQKKIDLSEDLEWITSKSTNKVKELVIKKLLREKKIISID